MSYREEGDSVILTMSREDYQRLLFRLGAAAASMVKCDGDVEQAMQIELEFMNRLNQGNPNYTPYQVEAKK